MKVLVLGGSGHIGNAVVRAFLDRNCRVTACSRRPEPPANLAGLSIRYAPGDFDTPGQFDEWIRGHDVVVDAAAPYPVRLFDATTNAGSRAMEYARQRTRALLAAVRKRKARLACVSSFTTLMRPRTGIDALEAALVRTTHPYFAVKQLIESELLDESSKGMPIVIVNPTMCLGPWDLRERDFCFIPRLVQGEMPIAMSHILNVIDVREVATGIVAALDAERYGEPILLSGHNVSTEALFTRICEIGGRSPAPRVYVPAAAAMLTSYFTEVALGLVGQRTPLPSLAPTLAYAHEWLSTGSAQIELNVVARPLSETLIDSIQWYRRIGYC
jgi:dihydroflavonol-4-reductase